ncbi:MAG: CBS domain-containing protein [Chloroflexi bacterium]|nr:CBS domain-containing protein [Chloroflexota bacterium]
MKVNDCMKHKVFSIPSSATIREAAEVFVARHIGLLPVVDEDGKLAGVVGLRDLLTLELPDFVNLVPDVDFVHDFGAVETTRPSRKELGQPVTVLMREAVSVVEECGLLRAYALMLQHDVHDLPVTSADGRLVGVASRVDIGTAILSYWKSLEPMKK